MTIRNAGAIRIASLRSGSGWLDYVQRVVLNGKRIVS
jgi:hypothetical protein